MIVSLASQISEPLSHSLGFASLKIPLVLALISSVVLTAWVTASLFIRTKSLDPTHPEDYHFAATTIWWPCESPRKLPHIEAYNDVAFAVVACLAVPASKIILYGPSS